MGRDPLKVQKRNGIQIRSGNQSPDSIHKIVIVFQRHSLADAITRSDLFRGLFRRSPLDEKIGIFRRSGVEMQNRRGIEDEHARTIIVQAEMKPVRLFILDRLHVISARRQWLDVREMVSKPIDDFHGSSLKGYSVETFERSNVKGHPPPHSATMGQLSHFLGSP